MIKAIVLTILVVFGLFDILLIAGCLRLEKKQDEYEAYERWKESKKNERMERGRPQDRERFGKTEQLNGKE